MPKRPENAVVLDGITHEIQAADKAEILVLADLHIGDRHSDVRLIQELIDSIRDIPNRYAVLAGDIMNNAIIGSKSDTYTETMTPMDQLSYAVKLLEPIKDKILAVVPGNHEDRTTRTAGFDLTLTTCAQLGIAQRYRENAALLLVRFGKKRDGHPLVYSIYVSHGHGGGRRVGGKLNSLQDYGQIIDTDIYVVGHTHLPASFKDSAFRVSMSRGTATLRERLFVNTASALRYGGYGMKGGYQPPSNSYPVITLYAKEHRMSATV